ATGTVLQTMVDAAAPDPIVSFVESDRAGRPLSAISPLGMQTSWEWSEPFLAAVTRRRGQLAATQRLTYDARGRVPPAEDRAPPAQLTYAAPGFGTAPRRMAFDGSATEATRCELRAPGGRLLEAVMPEGNRVRYSYDGEGRVVQVVAGSI